VYLAVIARNQESRRQNVGSLADSEGIRPIAGTRNRHMQAQLVPPAGIEPATPGLGIAVDARRELSSKLNG